MRKQRSAYLLLLLLLAVTACAGGGGGAVQRGGQLLPSVLGAVRMHPHDPGRYIKHVVIIVQENRSFDNFFAGYPGADSQMSGYTSDGKQEVLHEIGFKKALIIDHSRGSALAALNGGAMNGFDQEWLDSNGHHAGKVPYARVQRRLVKPYWDMAHQYALGDRMFPTMLSGSFTAHLFLIASTTNINKHEALVDFPSNQPWNCYASAGTTTALLSTSGNYKNNGPFPCFTQFKTMADTLDEKGVSWRYYAPSSGDEGWNVWSEFLAFKKIAYGPDAVNVVTPETTVLGDAASANLASVSWVIPDWADSDHSFAGSDTGPSWVCAVVNAIGEGPDWNSTAIFIVWDDWGGFYDNVPPPQLDFRGLGIRVPFLIVSPYAKSGYVDHTQYESGSLLKFVEHTFHLRPLGPASEGYTDSRANSPIGAFDFTQAPRAFTPIPAKYPATYFLTRPPSHHCVDDQ